MQPHVFVFSEIAEPFTSMPYVCFVTMKHDLYSYWIHVYICMFVVDELTVILSMHHVVVRCVALNRLTAFLKTMI